MSKHLFCVMVCIITTLLLWGGQAQADIWGAAYKGDVQAVKKYLARGANVNAKNELSMTN